MRCPCNDANCTINKLDAELQEARKAAKDYFDRWIENEKEFNRYCKTPSDVKSYIKVSISKYPWLKEENE